MEKIDCLLIHTPKLNNYYYPMGHYISVNLMPMGLLAMADFIHKNGYKCKIIHQAVEWINCKTWKLEDTLNDIVPMVFALSLHWHHQSYDVIESCRKIRKRYPGAFIVLGGFTASFFYNEILKSHKEIDGIIKGDGEIPLLKLIQALKSGKQDLSNIPNLIWKKKNQKIICNEVSYVADEIILNELCFTNFELLNNYRIYRDYINGFGCFIKDLSKEKNTKLSESQKMFPLCTGRGCPFNCTWCGGSYLPQREKISCRNNIIRRNSIPVIKDIQQAIEYGYETMLIAFDPTPEVENYYIELFNKISAKGLGKRTGCLFEAHGLPSKEFVNVFSETFDGYRMIMISPESGNENIRKRNRGYYFTNKNLLDFIEYCVKKDIKIMVCFSYGLPGENDDLIKDTIRLRNKLANIDKNKISFYISPIEIEPGSPWHIDPDKYGIVLSSKSFNDFYQMHSEQSEQMDGNSMLKCGYYINNYFKKPLDPNNPEKDFENRIRQIRCKHFCILRPLSNSKLRNKVMCLFVRLSTFIIGKTERHKWVRVSKNL